MGLGKHGNGKAARAEQFLPYFRDRLFQVASSTWMERYRSFISLSSGQGQLLECGSRLEAHILEPSEQRPEDARKALSAVLSKNDASSPTRLMLAGTEMQAGNSAAAISQYYKILEGDTRNTDALEGLTYFLADQAHQPDEALRYAQQAKELAPYPQVDETLGWV